MEKKYKMNLGFSLFVIFFSILLITVVIPFQINVPDELKGSYLSPASAPMAYSSFLGIMGIIFLVSTVLEKRLQISKDSETNISSDEDKNENKKSLLITLKLWLVFFIFVILLQYIGILFSSILFMSFITFYFGNNYRKLTIIISVVIPLAIYLFFYYVAEISLPQGLLFEYLS